MTTLCLCKLHTSPQKKKKMICNQKLFYRLSESSHYQT
ncbi:hypothetical protein LDG_5134 [Legionella drancourtii LLAP12]|uniref:Uncharacterized protein n=1 Tax=Legionella drancourtii LLAP12 TaxID=658187 RepID=G9EIX7_9GAMM|nr:hypothetical protein LDG_5134 [Legionella drancourtii LLAP12]